MSWRPKLLFHRLMLPNWLRNSDAVEWNSGALDVAQSNDLQLVIKQDSSDWENIFRILLIPKNELAEEADITVKMKVGVVLPEPSQPRDPMSYMISDGDKSSFLIQTAITVRRGHTWRWKASQQRTS